MFSQYIKFHCLRAIRSMGASVDAYFHEQKLCMNAKTIRYVWGSIRCLRCCCHVLWGAFSLPAACHRLFALSDFADLPAAASCSSAFRSQIYCAASVIVASSCAAAGNRIMQPQEMKFRDRGGATGGSWYWCSRMISARNQTVKLESSLLFVTGPRLWDSGWRLGR